MLYSTTKHTLKNELGAHHFLDEVHGTEKKDFSPEGFQEYKAHAASEAPLTQEELLKKEEVRYCSWMSYLFVPFCLNI